MNLFAILSWRRLLLLRLQNLFDAPYILWLNWEFQFQRQFYIQQLHLPKCQLILTQNASFEDDTIDWLVMINHFSIETLDTIL